MSTGRNLLHDAYIYKRLKTKKRTRLMGLMILEMFGALRRFHVKMNFCVPAFFWLEWSGVEWSGVEWSGSGVEVESE